MTRKEEKAELIYKDECYAIRVSSPETRELSISSSENFASFRVFRGPQNIPARRGERLQRLQKIEMRVRTFQFHPVITSTRSNEEVVGWRAFARLAAAVGQLASALPDLIIDRQFRDALLILAKRRALLFSTYACPKLQSHDRAPSRKPDC